MNSIISLGHNLLVSLYLADCSLAKKETRNNCLSTACDLEVGSWCRWTVVDFILYKKWNQGSISFIGNIVIDPSVSLKETDQQTNQLSVDIGRSKADVSISSWNWWIVQSIGQQLICWFVGQYKFERFHVLKVKPQILVFQWGLYPGA